VRGILGSVTPALVNTKVNIPIRAVAAKVRVPTPESYALARLDALMERCWGRRLGLVVAPAGSGKTTLLARFASTAGVPVAWYRSESWDVSQDHLLRHLERAFAGILGDTAGGWRTVEEASSALERWSGNRMLLVVDDLHTIAGTEAEAALERFIDYTPTSVLTLVASRSLPAFNLTRLRISGALAEISGEDLRFRSWEVENLFRDFYREPLPPVELAELARRTEGWAAGLQLFHLATSGKASAERRRILRALGGGSRLVREYLARNVLDELPPSLRRFLIDSCVLGRLSGPICNRFLDRTDSHRLLQELERRQIFTSAIGDDGDYRYHEVLRSHLEHVLVEEVGEGALRLRYGQAGIVLEHLGAVPEALRAYCRAEDWSAVDRLLGRNGAQLAQGTGVWIDALPPAVLAHDPWLLLASARRHRAEGRWRTAVETYQLAERGFGSSEAMHLCQRERQTLAAWLTSTPAPAVDSIDLLRLAVSRDPLAIRDRKSVV
jgi:ATP/maltotriose-dependent transcriptional regulator MalT